ncbi:hypothetical protein HPB52_014051 [Rhipicephalus sanguineus]|uniref:Uncharacterized protein n=1 Tax=Rhipicephalus sanguineus TaxID=34632 RepID=A0A9D4Q159_RHISA|nr:hypothetical protein HPB52_014051 [Rhipicephalus sanguineus]
MTAATTVTGYDPISLQVVTMETPSLHQAMSSKNKYLAEIVKLWERKQSHAAAPPKGNGSSAVAQ